MIGKHQNTSRRMKVAGAGRNEWAMGRGLAYMVAIATCVFLIVISIAAGVWVLSQSIVDGLILLNLAVCPGLFPIGFLSLMLCGYLSDYRSEQARGILGPGSEMNLSHLMLLVFRAAILCASLSFVLRLALSPLLIP
jgi:hypothetical protein